MSHALTLGRRGLGRVWPNPAVGCVIVKDRQIVGRGHTADGGRPHAEPQALQQAGAAAKGATAYVTLEPCSHHGKTPPCADSLIAAGVARVVVATVDINPQVAGAGIARLRAAGITVDVGVLESEAKADHAGFFLTKSQDRPFVTLKLALTLDGRIATTTGDSQWITGPQSRAVVHAMRACHDAVMVGAGTVRADDPSLDVRGMGTVPQPVRVIVSGGLNLPLHSKLAQTAMSQPVWLCHGPTDASAWVRHGARSMPCAVKGTDVDMTDALRNLAQAGLTRVLCEGGGALAASLIKAGLVDELVIFQGPKLIGGDGLSGVGVLGVQVLADAPQMTLISQRQIGGDVMQRWQFA
ncbi:bifunctional diaminohydroxyphosphoribosylaminopyrimidine deaminase/5-amino-6-(5-phosphoribosylamino)uracil reductase RibD [Yoonia sp. MH D7]